MSEPVHTQLGARLRERTQPLAPDDEANGFAHAHLCEALLHSWEQVAEVFDPAGDVPPIAPLLDVDLCPGWALPWLGQVVGVQVPAGLTDDQARNLIRNVAGFSRGTPASLRAAAAMLLTGTKTVYFNERLANDPYRLGVVTLAAETPDPAATLAVLLAQKPGGIVLEYSAIGAQTYASVLVEFDSYAEAKAEYPTYRDMKTRLPD
jgi:hypothetical protein